MRKRRTRVKFRQVFCDIIEDDSRLWVTKLKQKFEVCYKCGDPEANSPDHHNPLSCGFRLIDQNAVLLCRLCNTIKSDLDPRLFYTKEEIRILESDYGVKTSEGYNRNFNIEMEFLHELVKDLPAEEIKANFLNSGLLDNYFHLNGKEVAEISYPNFMMDIKLDHQILHLEKLLVLDPENPYFIEQYDRYVKRTTPITPVVVGVKLTRNQRRRMASKKRRSEFRLKKRETNKNNEILGKESQSNEPTLQIEPIVEKKDVQTQKRDYNGDYDWGYWINNSIDIEMKKELSFELQPFCLLTDLLDKAAKKNDVVSLRDCEVLNIGFEYLDLDAYSKKIRIVVSRDGVPWFGFKIGANSSLSRMAERLIKRFDGQDYNQEVMAA